MATETNTENLPFVLYKQVTQSNGNPASNGTTLTRTFFNHSVVQTVYKDDTRRDWRSLIATGNNATSTLIGSEVRCIRKPGYASMTVDRGVNDAFGYRPTITQSAWLDFVDLAIPSHAVGNSENEADSKAKTAFVSRVNAQLQSYQGMQYLAEAKEAIRMLRDNTESTAEKTNKYLRQVQRDLKGLKRRKLPKKFRRLGDLAARAERIIKQRYLEYTYGVAPFKGAVVQAAETLSKIHNAGDSNETFRMVSAVGHASGAITSSAAGFDLGTYLKGTYRTETKTISSVVYRGVVYTELDNLDSVNRFLGLSDTDFLPTLWEWLPWSFVADYFTNISEIIDAISLARSRLRWVARTVINETTRENTSWVFDDKYPLTAYPTIKPRISNCSFMAPTQAWIRRNVSRATYHGDLIPDFSWSIPRPKQMINVLVLGANIKRSRSFITNFLT